MGVRGEIFSSKVILPNRTYFFNVKENRMGDLYLNIVESKNKETGGFDRQSVILFSDDLQQFLKGFDESLKVMEKAVREKRHSGGEKPARRDRDRQNAAGESTKRDERAERPRQRQAFGGGKPFRGERPGFQKQRQVSGDDKPWRDKPSGRHDRGRSNSAGEKPARSRRPEQGSGQRHERGRRVVVKKQDR